MENDQEYSAYQQRIDKLYEMRRYKDCIRLCKEAILAFPDEWRPYYTLVSSYYNSRNTEQAYETVNQAISHFPDNYMFWLSKGQILYFRKKYEEALLWLHKALGKVPDNVYVYALLAECYQRQEEYPKAVEYATKALAINPNQEIALKALTWSKVNTGSPEVQEVIERYLDTYPNHFDAHHVAAVYYLQAKKTEKAIGHFRAALRIQPDKERLFEPYKEFLLEHVPEYYVSQKPVMKAFLAFNLVGILAFFAALWMRWDLVAECAVGFQIVVSFYYLMTRNNYLVGLRKDNMKLYELFRQYKSDLLEYTVLLIVTLFCISELLYFGWIRVFNVLMVSVIYAPKSTFLRRVEADTTRFYPHYLLNVYMLVLFVYAFLAERPLFVLLSVLFLLTLLNVWYEVARSKKEYTLSS